MMMMMMTTTNVTFSWQWLWTASYYIPRCLEAWSATSLPTFRKNILIGAVRSSETSVIINHSKRRHNLRADVSLVQQNRGSFQDATRRAQTVHSYSELTWMQKDRKGSGHILFHRTITAFTCELRKNQENVHDVNTFSRLRLDQVHFETRNRWINLLGRTYCNVTDHRSTCLSSSFHDQRSLKFLHPLKH
jgi:hypothetical protein